MVVQLSILVGNVADLISLGYTRIEVHQSKDESNSFQEVTAPTVLPAILDSLVPATTFRMGGKLLKLRVNGAAEQAISFSTIIEFWTATQVMNRINEVIPSLASVSGGAVRLTSPTTGRASSVEITYNDAEDLGWIAGSVYGKAVRITLVGGTLSYLFPDVAGISTDRYKWRFSANGALPVSGFSDVVSDQSAPAISSGNLSVGTAKFYGADGKPIKTRILVAVDSIPQSVVGVFVNGPQPITIDSTDDGFLQLTLIRGAKVRVAIEGTAYVREFVVPNAASFDLLTVMATATDPFTIQTTPPLLTRRSI